MTPTRSLQAELSDSRADSPMHEEGSVHRSASVPEGHSSEPPISRSNAPPSGFTAVNGEGSLSRFRPDTSARSLDPLQIGDHAISEVPDSAHTSPRGQPATWRPAEHEDGKRGTHANKRKRAHSGNVETAHRSSSPPAAPSSSKKRAALGNSRAASARSYEDRMLEAERRLAEATTLAIYARERSPDSTRWNNGEPPPPPRPDIEAGLAESIQREHLNKTHGRKSTAVSEQSEHQTIRPAPDPRSASPPEEGAKHRKRNFANRTKTGCHTCRRRKKKCSEEKPHCNNCTKGGFVCTGYGAKPPDDKAQRIRPQQYPYDRVPSALQTPTQRELTPSHYYAQPEPLPPSNSFATWDGVERVLQRPGEKWRHPPRYSEPIPPISRHYSGSRDTWVPRDALPPSIPDPRPPGDFNQSLSSAPWNQNRLPPPEPWNSPAIMVSNRPPTAAGTVYSSRESVVTSTSSGSQMPLRYVENGELSERSKMITGQPYRHFYDNELMQDRKDCKRALEAYNDAARASSTLSAAEKERLFKAIIDPSARVYDVQAALQSPGPRGSCGANVIVECPFICDYGFNIHFGDEVVVMPNCQLQDACDIYIGAGSIIGPNTKIYCVYTELDPAGRRGTQACFKAGAVKIGEGVRIGGNTIIMPFRTIGKYAVIGAGSVVTKDVAPYTVVGGNPAKVIRRIPPGECESTHKDPVIAEQNERMLKRMERGLRHGWRDRIL